MSKQLKNLQNSLEDSWATVSISDDSADPLSEPDNLLQQANDNYNSDDTNLDDTLPIDALDEMDGVEHFAYVGVTNPLHVLPLASKPDFPRGTPVPPKHMRDFQPPYCSSSIQLCNEGSSFDFSPQICSSKLGNDQQLNFKCASTTTSKQLGPAATEKNLKQPANIIREISKLKPYLRSISNLKTVSEEFQPQQCSTALSESQFVQQCCPTTLAENSDLFVPIQCSTGISKGCAMVSAIDEFVPRRCSTGLQENSVAFMPLRCSTGLNDSVTFNPPMSSTYQQVEDSHILEFKKLRLHSESRIVPNK